MRSVLPFVLICAVSLTAAFPPVAREITASTRIAAPDSYVADDPTAAVVVDDNGAPWTLEVIVDG
jgi:hypothetical protein